MAALDRNQPGSGADLARTWRRLLVGVWLTLNLHAAQAGVVITGTRLVYPQSAPEVTVRMTNTGAEPAMVQTWVDDGDRKAAVEDVQAPFFVSPPLFKIQPGATQLVRVIRTPERQAAASVERLFWFNVLEIPPKPRAQAGQNLLQFSVRTRIKLFLRPDRLMNKDAAAAVRSGLTWTVHRSDRGISLTAANSSPFIASIVSLTGVDTKGEPVGTPLTGMVGPHSSSTFELDDASGSPELPRRLRFQLIDDYGAFQLVETAVSAD